MPTPRIRSAATRGSSLEHLSPPIRCQLRGEIDENTERLALRAVLTAARLFGLAAGTHLRQLRNLDDPLADMQARLEEAQLHARLAWEIVEILSARFRKIPEKQRPHYSPSQRFRALEIRSLLGWSRDLAARVFLVCSNTISNWERSADPLAKTVGSTVKPVPPVRRFADAVRATDRSHGAQWLRRRGHDRPDARGAGWVVSARSVRSIAARTSSAVFPAGDPQRSRCAPSSLASSTTSG